MQTALKQNTLSKSGLAEKTLRSLSKIFGGLIPMHDSVRELKAKGFEEPERLIKKMLCDGRLYEPRKGFLGVLGD